MYRGFLKSMDAVAPVGVVLKIRGGGTGLLQMR
jgi:hypothetical protein